MLRSDRYRLEIRGRSGWFVPAAEMIFPASTAEPDIRHTLASSLASNGYSPDPELGETFNLRRLTDEELAARVPSGCAGGACKTRTARSEAHPAPV